MAADLSMNKIIHGAVRRDLARLVDALAAFPDGDRTRARQLDTAWTFFRGELDYHHRGEHAIAWPTLRTLGVDDEVIAQMDAEHENLAAALAEAGEHMRALTGEPSKAVADRAHAAMARLQDVAVEHLEHEERDVDPVYVAKRGTPELKAMGRQFAKDRSPRAAGDFFASLNNGASADERAALRSEVPPPVLVLLRTVFGRDYRRTVAPVWR